MGHKHVRFINACEKFLKKENGVETTNGLLNKVTNYRGEPYGFPPSANQLAQLLTRDPRFRQVDTTDIPDNKNGTYEVIVWGLTNA